MANTPKYEDKIVANTGGAVLYSYSNGETWNWDNKPVRLPEGQYLYSTGVSSENPKLGLMYEVYQWRVNGKPDSYRTREEARQSLNLIVNFTGINREQKWVLASQVRVENNSANTNNEPDPSSPASVEKSEKDKIEAELESQIYSKDSSQIRHTSLTKSTVNGKWMLGFQNGYTVEYEAFLALTPVTRRGLTGVKSDAGLTDPTGTGKGDSGDKETFPVWAYAVVGVLFVSLLVLVMQPFKNKKK